MASLKTGVITVASVLIAGYATALADGFAVKVDVVTP